MGIPKQGLSKEEIFASLERFKSLSEKPYKRHPYAAYTDA